MFYTSHHRVDWSQDSLDLNWSTTDLGEVSSVVSVGSEYLLKTTSSISDTSVTAPCLYINSYCDIFLHCGDRRSKFQWNRSFWNYRHWLQSPKLKVYDITTSIIRRFLINLIINIYGSSGVDVGGTDHAHMENIWSNKHIYFTGSLGRLRWWNSRSLRSHLRFLLPSKCLVCRSGRCMAGNYNKREIDACLLQHWWGHY